MVTPKQTDPQFKLRLSRELKSRIDAAAHTNNRSLNAEIVARLEGSLERDAQGQITLKLPSDLLDRIDHASNHEGLDNQTMIENALQAAFPPPTLSLGEIIDRIRGALNAGQVEGEKTRRELSEYLKGAEALIKAEPSYEHLSVNVEKQSPRD